MLQKGKQILLACSNLLFKNIFIFVKIIYKLFFHTPAMKNTVFQIEFKMPRSDKYPNVSLLFSLHISANVIGMRFGSCFVNNYSLLYGDNMLVSLPLTVWPHTGTNEIQSASR